MFDFINYLKNLFALNENNIVKFSLNNDSIEKSYQANQGRLENTKSKVFYVLSILSCIYMYIMMKLLTNPFQEQITIYLNLIAMIFETILFILLFYIDSNSTLFSIIKNTRYFLQCIVRIANLIFPLIDKIDFQTKMIYRVLIFNNLSYIYYIELGYISLASISSLNTMAIIYVQVYDFEKYELLCEILFSFSFGIIIFFVKKSEFHSKIKSKFYILVIDDQILVRKSTVNLIKNVLISHNVHNYSIIEGFEDIDLLKLFIEDTENKIKCVFINENIKFLKGVEIVKLVRRLVELNINKIYNISIQTPLEDEQRKKKILISGVNTILGKPCTKSLIFTVLKHINIIN